MKPEVPHGSHGFRLVPDGEFCHADLAFPSAADFQFADAADSFTFLPFKSPTDFTDSHGFRLVFGGEFVAHGSHGFFTFLPLKVTQISQMTQISFTFLPFKSPTDFTDSHRFLPFYL